MENIAKEKAYYHLPGLFEFYDLYSVFLPLYKVTKLPVLIAQGATYNMRFLLILGLYCVILST